MKRVPMTFLVLAVTGGCMAIEPDPIEDPVPYARPQNVSAQAQSWSYSPQSAKTAAQNTNTKTEHLPQPAKTAVASTNKKTEDTVVKASYSESKPAQNDHPPTNLGMLRLTNNKRITFHCESNDASTGATNLEIWGTTDMRNWKKFETAARSPSSLAVEVKDEGLYGFTMIARGKDEPKDQPPTSEPPEVWVAVDLTKPVVELLDAERNAAAQTPGLVVRWNAKDRNFGPQPITVLYAERSEGPWLPLAADVENNGRYEGPLPPHPADNVYVRVQAADLVGNVGVSQITVLRTSSRSATSPARVPQPTGPVLSLDGE